MESPQTFSTTDQTKPLWASVAAAAAVTAVAAVIAAAAKNGAFATNLTITALFSIAISAGYVVIDTKFLRAAHARDTAGQTEDAARQMVMRIMVASIAKNLLLAGVLICLVVVFKFDPVAVIIGVTVNYAAFLCVPWFYRQQVGNDIPSQDVGNDIPSQDKDV